MNTLCPFSPGTPDAYSEGEPHVRNDDIIGRENIRENIDEMIRVYAAGLFAIFRQNNRIFPLPLLTLREPLAPPLIIQLRRGKAADLVLSRKVLRRSEFLDGD